MLVCGVALVAFGGCGGDQGIDNATRASVFDDLASTSARLLRVPDPYRVRVPDAADELAVSAEKIRRKIGNGLVEVGTRYVVDRDGREIAALQVVVFSALAPTESAGQFVAGIEELNGPFETYTVGQSQLRRSASYRLWAQARTVVVFAVIDPVSIDDLVARYLVRHG